MGENEVKTNNKNNRKVDWRVFTWVIGIIFITISALWAAYARIETKINFVNEQYEEIQYKLTRLEVNQEWMMRKLEARDVGNNR